MAEIPLLIVFSIKFTGATDQKKILNLNLKHPPKASSAMISRVWAQSGSATKDTKVEHLVTPRLRIWVSHPSTWKSEKTTDAQSFDIACESPDVMHTQHPQVPKRAT